VSEDKPIKVAIIGGGCASMAAAFELTRPEHAGKYQLTVYQLGWRLGGKGASGRGPANRIEEHGLHIWMGFYENAFRLMRECYAELARDRAQCPIADWQDAFVAAPLVGVMERHSDGHWSPWAANFPPTEGLPGDPQTQPVRFSVADYLGRAVSLLRTLLESVSVAKPGSATTARRRDASPQSDSLLDRLSSFLRFGELASLASLIEAIAVLETMLGDLSAYTENVLLRFLDALAANARNLLEERAAEDAELRRVWTILDLTLATTRGMVRFGLITDPRGFDAVDEYDCREWLLLNGASEQSVHSAYLRGLYDLVFAYEDGDTARPRISAGQALRSTLRAFFTYRGAFFWKIQAGMGDAVFAPLYEVLTKRGVRFEFFHRLENVTLADPASVQPGESAYVESLEVDVQAEIKGGEEYRPLIDVHGIPCWPARPDYEQLIDGARLQREGWDFESAWERRKARRKILRAGKDFDIVVLGVGIGAIPHVCREIVARDPRWRAMVDHVKTVATQAFQIWLKADMRDLGWADPPITLSGFAQPFDTWADMRHLIPLETWKRRPRGLAYFCSVLPNVADSGARSGAEYLREQRMRVRRNAVKFLNHEVAHLWPRAVHQPGKFRWELLVDPNGRHSGKAEKRFESQFWTANVNPSDRYVLSLPGSAAYRISPLDYTYDNLTVAGDWTDCGFNAGCVEAAVMSGRLAAHAISGSPRLEDVVGFDHP
jgi:uncharacterized protein with NAD-binding domain and iron-sulfur cluster